MITNTEVEALQRHELLTLQAVSCSHDYPASKYDIAHSSSKCYITKEPLMSEPQFPYCIQICLVLSWTQKIDQQRVILLVLVLEFLLYCGTILADHDSLLICHHCQVFFGWDTWCDCMQDWDCCPDFGIKQAFFIHLLEVHFGVISCIHNYQCRGQWLHIREQMFLLGFSKHVLDFDWFLFSLHCEINGMKWNWLKCSGHFSFNVCGRSRVSIWSILPVTEMF